MASNRRVVLKTERTAFFQEFVPDLHRGESDVQLDGFVEQQPDALSVLADETDPRGDRRVRVVEIQPLAVEQHFAPRRVGSHDAVRDPQFSLAGESAYPHDLALFDLEVDPLDHLAGHSDMQITYAHHDFVRYFARLGLHPADRHLAADHQGGYFHRVRILDLFRGDKFSVAQNRDSVRDSNDLVEPVADENNADSLRGKPFHGGKQILRLTLRKHRRGLVEDENLDACLIYLAGYLDELHVPHGKPRDHDEFVDAHVELIQRFAGIGVHSDHVERFKAFAENSGDDVLSGYFPVDFDVLRD